MDFPRPRRLISPGEPALTAINHLSRAKPTWQLITLSASSSSQKSAKIPPNILEKRHSRTTPQRRGRTESLGSAAQTALVSVSVPTRGEFGWRHSTSRAQQLLGLKAFPWPRMCLSCKFGDQRSGRVCAEMLHRWWTPRSSVSGHHQYRRKARTSRGTVPGDGTGATTTEGEL